MRVPLTNTRARPWALVAATAAVGLASVGCGSSTVERYCRYGAVSQAQLDGCTSHVTEDEVRSYDTHAARYATGDLHDCLDDAGPYCKP